MPVRHRKRNGYDLTSRVNVEDEEIRFFFTLRTCLMLCVSNTGVFASIDIQFESNNFWVIWLMRFIINYDRTLKSWDCNMFFSSLFALFFLLLLKIEQFSISFLFSTELCVNYYVLCCMDYYINQLIRVNGSKACSCPLDTL